MAKKTKKNGLQNHEPKPPLPTHNQTTRTAVRRRRVTPEMQLSVLPGGRPRGPQHARNRPEKKQKSGGGFLVENEQQLGSMPACLEGNQEENEIILMY